LRSNICATCAGLLTSKFVSRQRGGGNSNRTPRQGDASTAPLAVTMGEPAGIGGELTLAAWRRRDARMPPFVAIDDAGRLRALAECLGLSVPIREVSTPAEALDIFAAALPVLPVPAPAAAAPLGTVLSGRPNAGTAGWVLGSIRHAVALAQSGQCGGVVTNPIQKKPLYDAGFPHPGHTEFLGAIAGLADAPVMMLVVPGLRAVPVTVHLPLAEAISSLNTETIIRHGRETARALALDFGLPDPRIAVAGLNPHAGETGALGRQEIEIIAPAIAALRGEWINATGPFPADTLFHPAAREGYDAVLCMYHDQALIPVKTIDFAGGVNVTLGLPFVRTSPDHGTALDIAGTGAADPASFIAALGLAAAMASRRKMSRTPGQTANAGA
jgi:4-hydroxythreonine-4-phosphate dehydrogenase